MNTIELDSMEFRDDWHVHEFKRTGESNSAWRPYGRVLKWCRFMSRFRRFGEWNVQETCSSAACRGTVRARMSGPAGTVEAWNGFEVFFVPKGVSFSKQPWPDCRAEDEANGIVWWPELPYEGGKYADHAKKARVHFEECVERACIMAGIQERLEL